MTNRSAAPPSPDGIESCGGCKYFWPSTDDVGAAGYCVRYPPRPLFITIGSLTPDRVQTHYPEVPPEWWCGEFVKSN